MIEREWHQPVGRVATSGSYLTLCRNCHQPSGATGVSGSAAHTLTYGFGFGFAGPPIADAWVMPKRVRQNGGSSCDR